MIEIDNLVNNQESKPKTETKEEVLRQIILEDFQSMLSFEHEKVPTNYPTSIKPRWKN